MLAITPSSAVDKETFSKAWIELDRSTFLPRRYHLISPDGKSTSHDLLRNSLIAITEQSIPNRTATSDNEPYVLLQPHSRR